MKRFIFFSALLFLSVTLWSSTASAAGSTYYSGPPVALNACTAAIESRCNGNCSCVQLTSSEVSSVYGRTNAGGWGHWTGSVWGNGYMYSNSNSGCSSDQVVDPNSGQCVSDEPPGPVCTSDTIDGWGLYGSNSSGDTIQIGDTGPRIANVDSCAYTCYVDYDMLDGYTTFADAHQCTGMSQPFVDQEPSSYTDPDVCAVRSNLGECLELAQQSGPCAAGTTYGRVNDIEVCVPSGKSTAAADAGSTGVPDAGGSQQATGTADSAGTGGLSTGSGTSSGSSSGSSTTTDNGDGTTTTVSDGESTEESTGPKTFGGHGDPASWWVSKYPEGAAGIGQNFSETIQNSSLMGILSPLESLPDSGSAPVWTMNFNLGPMGNFGSMSYELPNGFWLFIKFCVLFTAAWTCRALIFGG
jgi:hypothetical protein